jgi:hypothetical protein
VIQDLEDYADVAEEQGWRVRRTGNRSYQFFPKNGGQIVTLHRSTDHTAPTNWRAQLRRAGLVIPEDTQRPKRKETVPTMPPENQSAPEVPTPPANLSLDQLVSAARSCIYEINDHAATLEGLVKAIAQHASQGSKKADRIRELMKELSE